MGMTEQVGSITGGGLNGIVVILAEVRGSAVQDVIHSLLAQRR
jgi:hypothetical protein